MSQDDNLKSNRNDYLKTALNYLDSALILSNGLEAKDQVLEWQLYLSKIYASMNDYKKAYDFFTLSSQTKDSIFNDELSNRVANLEAIREIDLNEKELLTLKEKKLDACNHYFFKRANSYLFSRSSHIS